MPANTAPIFVATPDIMGARWLNADGINNNLDGTGTIKTLFTAGANGSYLDKMVVKAVGTNAAVHAIRLFLHDGTTYFLFNELVFPAVTVTSTSGQPALSVPLGFAIPTGWSVRAAVSGAAAPSVGFHFTTYGGDY